VQYNPTSFRLTTEALEALERLRSGVGLPRSRIIELALHHLERDWQEGRVRGITPLVPSEVGAEA
jgi:predicted transcriptional regulator